MSDDAGGPGSGSPGDSRDPDGSGQSDDSWLADGSGQSDDPGLADGSRPVDDSWPSGDSAFSRLAPLASGVRFGQFASVGVVGAVFDNATLATLRLALGVPEMLAKAAGVEVAILVMFAVNERWTFADHGRSGRLAVFRRLVKSHLVRSGGVAVQLVVYWVLTQRLAVTLEVFGRDLWFLAASPIAIGVAMLVNYCFESVFTWQVHRE